MLLKLNYTKFNKKMDEACYLFDIFIVNIIILIITFLISYKFNNSFSKTLDNNKISIILLCFVIYTSILYLYVNITDIFCKSFTYNKNQHIIYKNNIDNLNGFSVLNYVILLNRTNIIIAFYNFFYYIILPLLLIYIQNKHTKNSNNYIDMNIQNTYKSEEIAIVYNTIMTDKISKEQNINNFSNLKFIKTITIYYIIYLFSFVLINIFYIILYNIRNISITISFYESINNSNKILNKFIQNILTLSDLNNIFTIINYSNFEILYILSIIICLIYIPIGIELLIKNSINEIYSETIKPNNSNIYNQKSISKEFEQCQKIIKHLISEKVMIGKALSKEEKNKLYETKLKLSILDRKQEIINVKNNTLDAIFSYFILLFKIFFVLYFIFFVFCLIISFCYNFYNNVVIKILYYYNLNNKNNFLKLSNKSSYNCGFKCGFLLNLYENIKLISKYDNKNQYIYYNKYLYFQNFLMLISNKDILNLHQHSVENYEVKNNYLLQYINYFKSLFNNTNFKAIILVSTILITLIKSLEKGLLEKGIYCINFNLKNKKFYNKINHYCFNQNRDSSISNIIFYSIYLLGTIGILDIVLNLIPNYSNFGMSYFICNSINYFDKSSKCYISNYTTMKSIFSIKFRLLNTIYIFFPMLFILNFVYHLILNIFIHCEKSKKETFNTRFNSNKHNNEDKEALI